MRYLVFVVMLAVAAPARADVAADIKQSFKTFVDGVGKKQVGKLDDFITPGMTLDQLAAAIPKPAVTFLAVVPSASGTSAWLAAEISARVPREDRKSKVKVRDEVLRASAFLVLERGVWRVTATQWTAAMPNVDAELCGIHVPMDNMDTRVPKDFLATTTAVVAALRKSHDGGFRALMSDDKRALLIGSAAKEKFTGGPAIKALFKKWNVHIIEAEYQVGDKKIALPAHAGGGTDLMWIATRVLSNPQFCTEYDALFVLAKEPAGWRIVHQHYAEPYSSR